MEQKKRKQHYVFQAYLNAWTVENKLWCMREKKNIFDTGTLNVAQERDFYRIKPLNPEEIEFYHLFMNRKNPNIQKAMSDHMKAHQAPLEWKKQLEDVRHFIEETYGGIDKIPAELKEELLKLEQQVDVSINNLEENYHGDVEGDGTRWLGSLQKKDISFYTNASEADKGYYDDERFGFLYFLCVQ